MRRLSSTARHGLKNDAGFSLVELLLAMAIGTIVMGATMTALADAMRANDAVLRMTRMNNSLRLAMDLMVRDLLQVGSGLPPGHVILTPSGAGSLLLRIPGPPGTALTNVAGDTDMSAVLPGTALGPTINSVASDIITVLTADNTFTDMPLSAVTSTSVTLPATFDFGAGPVPIDIGAGPDRVTTGQLMMVSKGSLSALVQVTTVDAATRRLTFANGDSLRLNQTAAAQGTLATLNAAAPTGAAAPAATRVTRVRMISYYLDATVAGQPRLVRRINNGHPTVFNNALGTVVGADIEGLQISYDLADGVSNPAGVRFLPADVAGTAGGRCLPNPCAATQIRKVNLTLTARSTTADARARVFRNTLTSQISLRGMAFINEYQAP